MTNDSNNSPEDSEETVEFGGEEFPSQIGEYLIVRKIGGGGMVVVYEAMHSHLKKRVALKVLSDSQSERRTSWRRFFREMEVIGKLEHPHVVRATDAGERNGIPFLVMEFVDGADLSRVVKQYGPLPPIAVLDVLLQTAEALGHIHSNGLVHRDIKPSNLLLDKWGNIKVADLGLAQLQDPDPTVEDLTTMGTVIGTIDYMSPEQADPPHAIDLRADIYSLGCCLYFLLSGEPVFKAASRMDRLVAHRTGTPPDLPVCRGVQLPECLAKLFKEMLAKSPDERPANIAQVVDRLNACREPLLAAIREARYAEPLALGEKRLPLDAGIADVARAVFSGEVVNAGLLQTTIKVPVQRLPKSKKKKWLWQSIASIAMFALIAFGLVQWLDDEKPDRSESIPPNGANLKPSDPDFVGSDPEDPGDPEDSEDSAIVFTGHRKGVFCVRYSADGSKVVAATGDGTVHIWDIATKKQDHVLETDSKKTLTSAFFVPETDLVAASCYDGCIYIWNWKTGERIHNSKVHKIRAECVAWVHGTRILSSGVGIDDPMIVSDLVTMEEVGRFENKHPAGVRSLAVSPDGHFAMAGAYDGTLSYWNLDLQQLLGMPHIEGSAGGVWCLDWSPQAV